MTSSEKVLLGILFLIVFFCVFSISYYAIRSSNDEFWHIKTGEYIVQHGYHLPQKDIFTYTADTMDWANHEWLSQVIFYYVYHLSGFQGFVLFKSILIVLAFLGVYCVVQQRCQNYYIALSVTLLGALASRHTLYPRPYIFSYLLVPIYLYFLYELTEKGIKKYHYWIFPLLMIPWANLHGGAILGLILILFFLAGEFIGQVFKSKFAASGMSFILSRRLLFIFVLTLLASLINPYGFQIFELTFKVMNDKLLIASIGELHPPEFDKTIYYDAMLIITGITVLLTVRQLRIWDFFLLLFFGQQSLTHVRNLPLFGITAAAILGRHIIIFLHSKLRVETSHRDVSTIKTFSTILILVLAVSILVYYHQWDLNMEMLNGPGYRVRDYPVRAAHFILQNDFHGNMFNEINFAGYLMFALYPKYKVFTDNRFDLFGSKFLPDFYQIDEVGPRWQETLDKYTVNFIITERASTLRKALDQSSNWVRVYLDPGYAIYVKNIPENADLITRCRESLNRLGLTY